MFGFLHSWQLPWAGGAAWREPWTLDRNWHRAQAERCLNAGNYREAQRHLRIAIEQADLRKAPVKQRIRLRLELADAQRRMAALDRGPTTQLLGSAEASAREALALAAEGSYAEEYVLALDALADVYADRGDYPALERVEEEAIPKGAALPHPDPLRMARRVHRLAVARHHSGHRAAAIPALEKSIRLHEQIFGPNSRSLAALLHEAGVIFRAQQEHARAQQCLQRALHIHEAEFGPDSAEAFADLQQLAGSYEDAGDLDAAAAQYERALTMKMRRVGVQHIAELAAMQFSLANLYVGWGKLARARELLSDCLGAFRREGGAKLAVVHELLAQIEERTGRFHSAVKELEAAGRAWEKAGRTPELIRNLNYRAELLDQLRKPGEAEYLRQRVAALEAADGARAQTA
jgi:tetratricopeptide (TPR) repeat protein